MTLRRRLVLVFGVFLLLLAANAGQAWVNLSARDTTLAEITRMEELRDVAARLLAAYVDQQAGLRSYLITGEHRFLTLYESGREAARTHHGELEGLIGGDDQLRATVERLVRAEQRWHDEVAEPEILALRGGRRGDATAIESTGTATSRFDDLRVEVRELRQALRQRQSQAQLRLDATRRGMEAVAVQTFAAGLVVLVAAAWLLRRWVT